jgi:hypothetical protein
MPLGCSIEMLQFHSRGCSPRLDRLCDRPAPGKTLAAFGRNSTEKPLHGYVGHTKLMLGPLAHRLYYDDPRDGSCDNGLRVSGFVQAHLERGGLDSWSLVAAVIFTSVVMVLLLAALHGAECGIWAAAYLWLGAIDSPPDALLFSVDSITTRGASRLAMLHLDSRRIRCRGSTPRFTFIPLRMSLSSFRTASLISSLTESGSERRRATW